MYWWEAEPIISWARTDDVERSRQSGEVLGAGRRPWRFNSANDRKSYWTFRLGGRDHRPSLRAPIASVDQNIFFSFLYFHFPTTHLSTQPPTIHHPPSTSHADKKWKI